MRRRRPHSGPARHLHAARPHAASPATDQACAVGRRPARRHRPDLARARAPHAVLRGRMAAHLRRTHPHRQPDERSLAADHPSHRHRPDPRAARPPSPLHPRPVPEHRHRTGRRSVGRPGSALPRQHPAGAGTARTRRYRRRRRGAGPGHTGRLARPGARGGHPFSAAHTFAQTGPFRPRNLVRGTANAVLAGCGTTPGVGVPTVLLSGKLAAARITGRHATPVPGRVRTAPTASEGTPS